MTYLIVIMRKIFIKIKAIILTPIFLLYYFITSPNKKNIITQDFYAWCEYKSMPCTLFSFLKLFSEYKEFRSVIYMRLGIFRIFISWLFRGLDSLYLCNNIGPGLIIQHGFSTIIAAKQLGSNCKVFQQVTVGFGKRGNPTLGNNVIVCCGAKVIGKIKIGNDVIIGANADVIKDVPDHSIVAGIPAKIIKKRQSMDEEWVDYKCNKLV